MYMIWSTKNKPFRDCSLWYRGCYAIGWAIEGCPGKGILDNPHIYADLFIYLFVYSQLDISDQVWDVLWILWIVQICLDHVGESCKGRKVSAGYDPTAIERLRKIQGRTQ